MSSRLTFLFFCYRWDTIYPALATTSPPLTPLLTASLASNQPSLPQSTTPISPIASGGTNLLLL